MTTKSGSASKGKVKPTARVATVVVARIFVAAGGGGGGEGGGQS